MGIGVVGFDGGGLVPLSPSPTAAAAADVAVLSFGQALWALGLLLIAMIATGVVLLAFRRRTWWVRTAKAPARRSDGSAGSDDSDDDPPESKEGETFVRSLVALWLVLGLIVLAVLSLAVGDAPLRSTLVGGITASAGAAVAFYFSSKASSEARRDILSATSATVAEVPDLVGLSIAAAQALMAKQSGLTLEVGSAQPTDVISAQTPSAGTRVARDTAVAVTAAPASAQDTA